MLRLPPFPTTGDVQKALGWKPAPLPPGKYEFALVLGGTVSAGAYTAGAIDFLIEALDCFDTEKEKSGLPYHDITLKVVTGTSGGAVVAAIMARALAYDFPSHFLGAPPIAAGQAGNPLYDIWVKELDLAAMLDTSDIAASRSLTSLLNVTPINNGAHQVETYPGTLAAASKPRRWVGAPLTVILTHTNLTGLPVRIDFGQNLSMSFVTHADYGRFAVAYPWQEDIPPPQPYEFSLAFPGQKQQDGWSIFGDFAVASAAFPLAFIPRDLHRPLLHYAYRAVSASLEPSTESDLWVPSYDWTSVLNDTNYITYGNISYSTLDGGMCDNEPIELGRTALVGLLHRNPRDGTEANRSVVLIDPFHGETDLNAFPITGLLQTGGAAITAAMQQGNYSTSDLVLALDPSIYSRYMLSAERDGLLGGKALATAGLSAFMGFTCEAFREHDYYLGRQNCQTFLRKIFRLPADNKVFDRWREAHIDPTPFRNEKGELPLIPLFGPASQPEGRKPRPYKALDPASLRPAIEKRVDAVINTELPDNFLGHLRASGGDLLAGGKAADYVLGLIQNSLEA